jgi:hypothetical protein
MEMLGLPLEERKKAYAGVDLSSLITKYNQAEKQGDLPTMLALLDIIKAAPKGKTPPMTTVKDDIMAQAMPQPMPQMQPQMQPQASVPGFEGAVTALENQEMPVSGMANGGPVMNVMRDGDAYDDQPGRDEYAEGGVVKMFGGGIPPYNVATASMDDLIRFAQFGDPKAGEELTRRQMSGFQYRPISQLNTPMPPGVSAQQAFANRPGGVPGAMPPSPSPAVTPGAAVPPASTTPPSLFSRAKDAVKLAGKGIGFLGKATPLLYAAQPLEANAGEADALAKLRLIDGLNLTGQELQLARDLAMSPKVSLERFTSKYFPASTAVASAPPPPSAGGAGTPGISGIDLSAFKPRSAAEEARAAEDFEASQIAAGKIRSKEDIQKDLEAFRTEGKTRAESDRTAAKEAFKENILLNAALAAPQFLRGRGLDQATARFSETFAPMALETASQKSKALKEATKFERDAEDKFRLAQLDMDKADRATSEGRYGRGQELEAKASQNYLTAQLEKYKSDIYYSVGMNAIDREVAKGMISAAAERVKSLQLNEQFRKLPMTDQQRIINSILQQATPGIGGIQTNRPPIQNVPG